MTEPMKSIILHHVDRRRSYHIFPSFEEGGMYKLIIANKLQPDHNVEVEFDNQPELDALLLAHKAPA